jgi:hypothetical protein
VLLRHPRIDMRQEQFAPISRQKDVPDLVALRLPNRRSVSVCVEIATANPRELADRQPVRSAPWTSRRKSFGQALTSRRVSSALRYLTTAASTRLNGVTFLHASSVATRPARKARLSAAFNCVKTRFAVARRARRASSVLGIGRVGCFVAFRFFRTLLARVARSLRHFVRREYVKLSTSRSPSSGRITLNAYSIFLTAEGDFSAWISSM